MDISSVHMFESLKCSYRSVDSCQFAESLGENSGDEHHVPAFRAYHCLPGDFQLCTTQHAVPQISDNYLQTFDLSGLEHFHVDGYAECVRPAS
jgi:hypothetical protein